MINTPCKHVLVTVECIDEQTELVHVQQEQYTLEDGETLIGVAMVYGSEVKKTLPKAKEVKKRTSKK